MEQRSVSRETLAAQALGEADPVSGGLAPVISPATNYERQLDGSYRQDRVYTRADNPTSELAERVLAALEGTGCACAVFASGMAAATAVFQSLLPGDHVLVSRVLYWGVRKWLAEFALTWGLDVEFADTTDLGAVAAAIRPGQTRLLWVETPANPMWEVTDLAAVCALAHAAGVRVAVDNTVATPVLTRPFEHGADLVVHSATKYLNGHSDVLAGAVLTARRDPFWERIRSWRRNAGAVLGPFEAWLLQRGMRTLFLRVHRASESALAIATQLSGHPALTAGAVPGAALASWPPDRGPPDERRVRRHAVDPAGRRSRARHRGAAGGPGVQAGHLAGRGGEPDRAPGRDGGPVLTRCPPTCCGCRSASKPSATWSPISSAALRRGRAMTELPWPPAAAGLTGQVAAALERSLLPSIIARGAARAGSRRPGRGSHPGADRISGRGRAAGRAHRSPDPRRRPRHHRRPDRHPRRPGTARSRRDPGRAGPPHPRQRDQPGHRGHRGRAVLAGAEDGWVRIRLDGGCQGCSLAEVTVRQGIEPLLRARLPGVIGVLDVTDHQAGTQPFFSPEKR